MTGYTDEEYLTLLRNDLMIFIARSFRELNPDTGFLYNWHIEAIARALEDCMAGRCHRLIINVPPRSLKSHCATVAFTAWLLGHIPSAQIICASYGQDLADKHARDTRTLMGSTIYRNVFQTRLASSKPALSQLITTQGGVRYATSVGGPLTGLGGDFLIIDDPSKPEEVNSDATRKSVNDWYSHTALSRLNNKENGCTIIIMQRMHEDDLVGHVLQSGEWRLLSFPAIAQQEEHHIFRGSDGKEIVIVRRDGDVLHPERESLQSLEETRSIIGTYFFASQYLQTPAPAGGAVIKEAWFNIYTRAEVPEEFELIFQSWDTANKIAELNDFSVCTTWGVYKKHLYLLHVLRRKLEFPDLKRLIRSHSQEWSAANVLIEDKASGTQLIQDLKREGLSQVRPYSSTLDKHMRLVSVTPTFENGFVHLPDQAPWLADYRHELLMFPGGRHDDQVDSTSQALDWYRSKRQLAYGLLEYYKEQGLLAEQGKPDRTMFMRPRGGPGKRNW